MPNLWKHVSFALSAMLVGALITGVVMSLPRGLRDDARAQDLGSSIGAADRAAVARQNLAAAQDLSSAFRNVAELLRPSVVSISTKQTRIIRRRGLPPGGAAPDRPGPRSGGRT